MLGKLLKYEWKATSRIFLPLYIAVIVTTFLNVFFMNISDFELIKKIPWLVMLFAFAYGAVVIATFVLSAAVMIQRYYKNILGSEGYLMNTLPVKGWELICSKGIISLFWIIGSLFVVIVSMPLSLFLVEPASMGEIFQAFFKAEYWKEFVEAWGGIGNFVLFLLELFFGVVIGCVESIMKIYAAMSLGHLIHKYRLLAAVGFYIAFGMVENMMIGILGTVFGETMYNILEKMDFFQSLSAGRFGAVNGLLLGGIVITFLLGSIYFFISKYVLDNKLNLE